MREILFRGKRLKDKKWIEGSLLVLDADSGYYFITEPYESASTLPVKDLIYNHTHLVDPETVCQFTGMTDENGVKIFEGDIVRDCDEENEVFVVKYYAHSGYAAFDVEPEINCDCNGLSYLMELGSAEVIGNIFDNPELTKGGEGDA